jgi:cystathionine beta-lyase
MDYNFDEIIDRQKTDSIKYDLRKLIFGREDVLPMWVADMDFKTPDFIIESIKNRLNHPILGYTLEPSGMDEAIMDWMKTRHGWHIRKEWIVSGPAVVPSMAVLVHAFSDPGDEIIVQKPVYFPFFRTITNHNRYILNNPLINRNGRYEMDLDDLNKKITPRTKMIFLCNPHNPGGRVWREKELKALADICLENNILIISDEIHSDLVLFGNKHIPTASINEDISRNTITCMSSSKTFNTAGLASAYVIISNLKNRRIYKEKLNDFHLNIGNIAGLFAQEAAYRNGSEWLEQLLKYLEGNIDYLVDFMQKHLPSVKVMKPEGTYLVWMDFRDANIDTKKLKKFIIEEAGLGLSDGFLFGEEGLGFQRLNLACPRSVLKKGLEGLLKAFNNFDRDETKQ